MKKRHFIAISLIAGVIAIWIILTKINIRDVLGAFEAADSIVVALYIITHIAIMLCLVWRWQIIIRSQQNIKVNAWDLFWYKVVGYGVSFVTPTAKVGGEPVRAGLLTRHKMSFKDALSTVVIDKTIELSTSGLFFVLGAVVVLTKTALPEKTQWLFILVSILFTALIGYFYYQMLNGQDFFGKFLRLMRLHKTKRGKKWQKSLLSFEKLIINFYHKDRKYFFGTIAITAVSWFFMFFEYKFILAILGAYHVGLLEIFLIFSFVGAAYLIPIPMALGSLEASQISVFKIINLDAAAGVALSFIIRLKDIVWTILGFIALSIYGLKLSTTVKQAQSLDKEIMRLEKGKK